MIYQNNQFSLVRKPQKIPSTFGNQTCLLDLFAIPEQLYQLWESDISIKEILPYIHVPGYTEVQNKEAWIQNQYHQFSKEEEYGLLNRLDNDTGGFVYFANTPQAKEEYKQFQSSLAIQKHYIARVSGNCPSQTISTPIFHHKNPQKMTTLLLKSRGEAHHVVTQVEYIAYDRESDSTLLRVKIQKGIRHQIRVHLASSGHPIIGDQLYKGPSSDILHLWSVGMEVNE